jgi:F420 biosynthesis protein FbiB-like protein
MSAALTPTDTTFITLLSRRSIRRYQARTVAPSLVTQILEAAIWAPSAHNRQPWRFAVITDAGLKSRLAEAMGERLRCDLAADGAPDAVIASDVQRSRQRITSAPCLIVVCLSMVDMDAYPDERRQHNEFLMAAQSTAMAGQNLLLAASALGLGACWMCAPLFAQDTVREVLSLPDDWQPQGMVTLGYPDETRVKTRHALEKSIMWR